MVEGLSRLTGKTLTFAEPAQWLELEDFLLGHKGNLDEDRSQRPQTRGQSKIGGLRQ